MPRSAIAASVAAVVLAFAAGPAAAAAPERFVDDFQFADTIDCSEFNPAWTFNDDFVDFFHVRGQVWLYGPRRPAACHRTCPSWFQRRQPASLGSRCTSTITFHMVQPPPTSSPARAHLAGADDIMQRQGGWRGTSAPATRRSPPCERRGAGGGRTDMADDADFCAAVAP